jgi:hypothetical protein
MKKCVFRCAFTVCLVLYSIPALAEYSARELLDKARDKAASEPLLRRIDTTEQSTAVIAGQNRMQQPPQTNVVQIEIDMARHLARNTSKVQGQDFIMLKQGEKAAMKLGTGPWEIPTGPYENLAKDMGNLFVCEIETPETKDNAVTWKLAGTELFDGNEVFVIESGGNTAVSIAQERMTKGIAKAYSGNPGNPPTVKVLEYSSKHWINKSDYRRLQAVQTSKYQVTFALPDGNSQLMETSSKATSKYSYEKFSIEIPEDAQNLLSKDSNSIK